MRYRCVKLALVGVVVAVAAVAASPVDAALRLRDTRGALTGTLVYTNPGGLDQRPRRTSLQIRNLRLIGRIVVGPGAFVGTVDVSILNATSTSPDSYVTGGLRQLPPAGAYTAYNVGGPIGFTGVDGDGRTLLGTCGDGGMSHLELDYRLNMVFCRFTYRGVTAKIFRIETEFVLLPTQGNGLSPIVPAPLGSPIRRGTILGRYHLAGECC